MVMAWWEEEVEVQVADLVLVAVVAIDVDCVAVEIHVVGGKVRQRTGSMMTVFYFLFLCCRCMKPLSRSGACARSLRDRASRRRYRGLRANFVRCMSGKEDVVGYKPQQKEQWQFANESTREAVEEENPLVRAFGAGPTDIFAAAAVQRSMCEFRAWLSPARCMCCVCCGSRHQGC